VKRSLAIVLVCVAGILALAILIQWKPSFAAGSEPISLDGEGHGGSAALRPESIVQPTNTAGPDEGTVVADPGTGGPCTSAKSVSGLVAVSIPLFLAITFVQRRPAA
jgi:hypothetical protein